MSVRKAISRRRVTPAGIESEADGYRIVQVDQAGGGRVRVALDVRADPSTSEIDQSELRRAVRALAGRRCVVSPPSSELVVRPARMPRLSGEEFREAARWEAAEMLTCDAGEVVAEPLIVSGMADEDGRYDVLIVATRVDSVNRALQPLLSAGLRPIAVEPSFLGAGRAYCLRSRRRDDDSVARAVLEIGQDCSNLVVMSADRAVFAKTIAIGGRSLDQSASERLGIDVVTAKQVRRDAANGRLDPELDRPLRDAIRRSVEELANEVAMSVRYVAVAARIGAVRVMHVCGEEAETPGLTEAIQEACPGIPVQSEEAADVRLIEAATLGGGAPRSWAAALGLALRPVEKVVRKVAA